MLGWLVSLFQLLSGFVTNIAAWFSWAVYMFISILHVASSAASTFVTVIPVPLAAAFDFVIAVLVIRFCIRLGR